MALQILWSKQEEAVSKEVWIEVNERLGSKTISRVSIINFLEDMRKKGIVNGKETTGKGGRYFVYSMPMNQAVFKEYIAKCLIEALLRNYPVETKLVIKKIRG